MASHHNWTENEDEDEILREKIKTMTHAQIAKEMGLSKQQVVRRASHLGINKHEDGTSQKKLFSKAEDSFIIENASHGSAWISMKMDRTIDSIKMRVKRLRKKGFPELSLGPDMSHCDQDNQFIIQHKDVMTCEAIGDVIGRGHDSVRHHLKNLLTQEDASQRKTSLGRAGPKIWEASENAIILSMIGSYSYAQIAENLPGRTEGAVGTQTKVLTSDLCAIRRVMLDSFGPSINCHSPRRFIKEYKFFQIHSCTYRGMKEFTVVLENGGTEVSTVYFGKRVSIPFVDYSDIDFQYLFAAKRPNGLDDFLQSELCRQYFERFAVFNISEWFQEQSSTGVTHLRAGNGIKYRD